jgi:dTDP-4-dehydrorhamnose 3,5-epimerase
VKVTNTGFAGLLVLEPAVFEDKRGSFFEAYNKTTFQNAGIDLDFVQDNQSSSSRGVLRGLHFQKPPYAQTKLIRVLSGCVQDVVVDIRRSQPTFGKCFSIELSAQNRKQLLVPKGFAHGFLVLSETAEVLYKCDSFYRPASEGGILHDDPSMGITWEISADHRIVSGKDMELPVLASVAGFD